MSMAATLKIIFLAITQQAVAGFCMKMQLDTHVQQNTFLVFLM